MPGGPPEQRVGAELHDPGAAGDGVALRARARPGREDDVHEVVDRQQLLRRGHGGDLGGRADAEHPEPRVGLQQRRRDHNGLRDEPDDVHVAGVRRAGGGADEEDEGGGAAVRAQAVRVLRERGFRPGEGVENEAPFPGRRRFQPAGEELLRAGHAQHHVSWLRVHVIPQQQHHRQHSSAELSLGI